MLVFLLIYESILILFVARADRKEKRNLKNIQTEENFQDLKRTA